MKRGCVMLGESGVGGLGDGPLTGSSAMALPGTAREAQDLLDQRLQDGAVRRLFFDLPGQLAVFVAFDLDASLENDERRRQAEEERSDAEALHRRVVEVRFQGFSGGGILGEQQEGLPGQVPFRDGLHALDSGAVHQGLP